MEQIGTKFKESGLSKIWTWITVMGLFIIVVAVLWMCFVLKTEHPVFYSCIISGAFFIVFVTLAVLFWMIFKKISECNEKSKEFNRKIDWEEFQFELNKARKNLEDIEGLNKKIESQEKEIAEYKATSDVIEREKNAQGVLLLMLGLSSQNEFTKCQSIEDKLKFIENNYEILKNKIVNIKL
jgi:hypothetical protein